jgi:hypothetical protein
MERYKRLLLVAASLTLVLALVLGSKQVHAGVALVVQVANTVLNPALTSNVDNAGRIPYQSTVDRSGECSPTGCSFSFPTVPAGHRVVVQHITAQLDFTGVPSSITLQTKSQQTGIFLSVFYPPLPQGGIPIVLFDKPQLYYVDSLQSVEVVVSVSGTKFGGAQPEQMTLTGYELDCSNATPCAPIATE